MNNGLIISFLLLFVFILSGWVLSILTSIIFSPTVHTPKKVLAEIFKILGLVEGENFFDLGSGDGRLLVYARKLKQINGFGYEISPLMVSISKLVKFINLGFNSDLNFEVESIFDIKLGKANTIYVYQNPKILKVLDRKFKKELKDTNVFSYKYEIEDKKPVKVHMLSNGISLFEYKY